MSDILAAILSAPESFNEAHFEEMEASCLTRAWISRFVALDQPDVAGSCESGEQRDICLAVFFHLVDELLARGCRPIEICALARLTAQFWQESMDRALPASVLSLQSALAPLVPRPVSERTAQLYLTYTARSFLQHFALYRACLATSDRSGRPDRRLRRGILVEAPDPPAPLAEGRKGDEHGYYCRLREIDTEEQLAKASRTGQRLDEAARLEESRRQLEERMKTRRPPRRRDEKDEEEEEEGEESEDGDSGEDERREEEEEYPISLIGECLDVNMRQLRLNVRDMAETSSIDLVYKAKRTALPRPVSMGPPPRYQAPGGVSNEGRKSAGSSRKSSAKSQGKAKSSRAK